MNLESGGQPAVLSEEIVRSPFAHFVATEAAEDVRQLIAEAATLVGRYAALAIGSTERIDVVVEMTERLVPIRFSSRLEPRATIANAWREAAEFASSRFFEAIVSLIRREDDAWNSEEIRVLLELLVETGLTIPPATAFLAQERLKLDHDRGMVTRSLSPLMSLVPNSGAAIFSMLERLRSDGMLRAPAVQSAVRKVARWDPDNLERILNLFGEVLFPPDEEPESVRFFVEDIIERAGLSSFTLALSGMDPSASPALIAAAFGGEDAPLSIELQMKGREPDLEPSRVILRQGARILPRSLLQEAAQDSEWFLKVRLTKGVTPIVTSTATILDGGISLDEGIEPFFEPAPVHSIDWDEYDAFNADDGNLSMSKNFATMMGVRIEA